MKILFPGRHHLLTDFQFKYLYKIIKTGLENEMDADGNRLGIKEPVSEIIFAVTSSNHSNTRRNPLPFYMRAMALQEFSRDLGIPSYIYGIDDVGTLEDFSSYTIKKIRHLSDGRFDLRPDNTVVLCSTDVLFLYEKLGFKILPAELENKKTKKYHTESPWELVEKIAQVGKNWESDWMILEKIHPVSYKIWIDYQIGDRVKVLFEDKMIGSDGDLTETRDYNSYVRQMDEIAGLKFKETSAFIRAGRIGDIGCAAGSWIKLAAGEKRFHESDFYGIEVSRYLYEICEQRKTNGDYQNPYVFFAQKNAVTGLVFNPGSMNTIHTSSLTHEIESYGGRKDLIQFIKNRYQELCSGGVWINRDVVGPDEKDEIVLMKLNQLDGINEINQEVNHEDRQIFMEYLNTLSTYGRFIQFAMDFRKKEGGLINYEIIKIKESDFIRLKLEDACEFIYKKDYTDNWMSEMHEKFCFWSFKNWIDQLESEGFRIVPESKAYSNEFIIQNRLQNKVEFYRMNGDQMVKMEYPVSHMILVAEKI